MIKYSIISIVYIIISFKCYSQTDSAVIFHSEGQPLPVITTDHNNVPTARNAQVYKLKPAIDIPIVVAGTAWSLYAFTKIYSKSRSSVEEIMRLKISDINKFDQWATYPYDKNLDDISYYPFYASIPYPLVYLAIDPATRKDYWKLSFLYWEAMAITGLFGTGATYNVDKYRPYAYFHETQKEIDKSTSQLSKNSFYAGHVQIVSVTTFFVAKVYADYHPESDCKWVPYAIASATTIATAYMRLKGGQHFPSDILLGAAMGTLTGILVPQFHKNRLIKNPDVGLVPVLGNEYKGFAFLYRIK